MSKQFPSPNLPFAFLNGTSIRNSISTSLRRLCLVAVAFFPLLLTGCAFCRVAPQGLFWWRSEPCALSPDATPEEILSHVNGNISRLTAWRSTDVRIRARGNAGLPVTLSSVLAVESPRNFRMMANSVAGNEVDLGSNQERFWFWVRRAEPKHVVTASHAVEAESHLRIPFRPEWLMDALSVVPIDAKTARFEREPNSTTARFITEQHTPLGKHVRKVVVVDACRGCVVEHRVEDVAGQVIAQAILSEHLVDSQSGIVLPHRIELNWPKADMALAMEIGHIEVNPTEMPEQTWQLPVIPGYPRLDLGELTFQNITPASHRPPPRGPHPPGPHHGPPPPHHQPPPPHHRPPLGPPGRNPVSIGAPVFE